MHPQRLCAQRCACASVWTHFDGVTYTRTEVAFASETFAHVRSRPYVDRYESRRAAMEYWMERCVIPLFEAHGELPAYEWRSQPDTRSRCAPPMQAHAAGVFAAAGHDLQSHLDVRASQRFSGIAGGFLTVDAARFDTLALYPGYVLDNRLYVRCPVGLYTGVAGAHLGVAAVGNEPQRLMTIVASPCLAAAQVNHESQSRCNTIFNLNQHARVPPTLSPDGTVLQSGVAFYDYCKIVAKCAMVSGTEMQINYGKDFFSHATVSCMYCGMKDAASVAGEVQPCVGEIHSTSRAMKPCGLGLHLACFKRVQGRSAPATWRCDMHRADAVLIPSESVPVCDAASRVPTRTAVAPTAYISSPTLRSPASVAAMPPQRSTVQDVRPTAYITTPSVAAASVPVQASVPVRAAIRPAIGRPPRVPAGNRYAIVTLHGEPRLAFVIGNESGNWVMEYLDGERITLPLSSRAVVMHPDNPVLSSQQLDHRFRCALLQQKLRVVVVLGDGACLYRAIAYHLFGSEQKHNELRRDVCDYMQANAGIRAVFSGDVTDSGQSFDDYVDAQREPLIYASGTEVRRRVACSCSRVTEIV